MLSIFNAGSDDMRPSAAGPKLGTYVAPTIYASPAYRFLIVLPVGKVGSTTVSRWLEKFFAEAFCNTSIQLDTLDNISPHCLKHLEDQNICFMYNDGLHPHSRGSWHGYRDPFISPRALLEYHSVVVMRDPYERYASTYHMLFEQRGSQALTELSLLTSSDPVCQHCAAHKNSPLSNHWMPQAPALLGTGLRRIDQIMCTETLNDDLSELIAVVNRRKQADLPPLSPPSQGHLYSHAKADFPNETNHDENSSTAKLKGLVQKEDALGRRYWTDLRLWRLYADDFKLNPCVQSWNQELQELAVIRG